MPSIKLTRLPHTAEVAFSVVQKLHANPFPGQRSHRLHLKEADYLQGKNNVRDLSDDQLVFHAVRYRDFVKGRRVWVTRLVDGYTRIEACLQDKMNAPDTVLLLTHVVADYDAAYAVYCRFNSTKAAKRGKHQVQSGIREATTKLGHPTDAFDSHLLLQGPTTSGLQYSGIRGTDTRAKASNGYGAMSLVNAMELRKNVETTGLMAAYFAIMERDGDTRLAFAKRFITGVNFHGKFEMRDIEDEAIIEARAYHNDRRSKRTTSGDRNVQSIRDRVLGYYQFFLDTAVRGPSAVLRTDMTLGMFKAAA